MPQEQQGGASAGSSASWYEGWLWEDEAADDNAAAEEEEDDHGTWLTWLLDDAANDAPQLSAADDTPKDEKSSSWFGMGGKKQAAEKRRMSKPREIVDVYHDFKEEKLINLMSEDQLKSLIAKSHLRLDEIARSKGGRSPVEVALIDGSPSKQAIVCLMCGGTTPNKAVYGRRGRECPTYQQEDSFLGLQLSVGAAFAIRHSKFSVATVGTWSLSGASLLDKLAVAVAKTECMQAAEFLCAVEFFVRTRSLMRSAGAIVHVCCGHGLTGLIFAMLENGVRKVFLVNKQKPTAHEAVLKAVCSVAPWVKVKTTFVEEESSRAGLKKLLPPETSVIGIHVGGTDADECIELAKETEGHVALMPASYQAPAPTLPNAIEEALGRGLASDVHRTYTLSASGYDVEWQAIPSVVSDKNRLLIGRRRGCKGAEVESLPDADPSAWTERLAKVAAAARGEATAVYGGAKQKTKKAESDDDDSWSDDDNGDVLKAVQRYSGTAMKRLSNALAEAATEVEAQMGAASSTEDETGRRPSLGGEGD